MDPNSQPQLPEHPYIVSETPQGEGPSRFNTRTLLMIGIVAGTLLLTGALFMIPPQKSNKQSPSLGSLSAAKKALDEELAPTSANPFTTPTPITNPFIETAEAASNPFDTESDQYQNPFEQ